MNLHLMVAGILGRLENDTNCRVLRDSRDCGGDHLVALYFDRPSATSRLCEVDYGIIWKGELRVIGETDANHKPAHLYGKLGTPKFARYVKYGDDCYPMANCVDFVQILTAPSDRSFKLKQWEGLMTTFQRDLDETPNGRIKRYQIL